jgi:hypothetical protein
MISRFSFTVQVHARFSEYSKPNGTEPAENYAFYYGNRNENHQLGTYYFVCTGIMSTVSSLSASWKINFNPK